MGPLCELYTVRISHALGGQSRNKPGRLRKAKPSRRLAEPREVVDAELPLQGVAASSGVGHDEDVIKIAHV